MATAALPRPRRSLFGKLTALRGPKARKLTAAAAFELNTIVGLAALCPILMVLEHQIADKP